jgi:hypothetical protein
MHPRIASALCALGVLIATLAAPWPAQAGDTSGTSTAHRAGDPWHMPERARTAPPRVSDPRALELEWNRQDVRRDQRRRAEEQRLRRSGDLRALDDYRARERRADETQAQREALDLQALTATDPAVAAPLAASRELEREQDQQDLRNRAWQIEERFRRGPGAPDR